MNVIKKVLVLVWVFGVFCLFTSGANAMDVLYAPFEGFDHTASGKTTVYVYDGGYLQPLCCDIQNGIITTAGKVGKALSFNGNRYITVPNKSSLNFGKDDFAITFWVKTKATKTNNTIIDKRESFLLPGYHVTLYNGRPLLHMCDASGWSNYFGGPPINDGKWHYVAIYVERNNPTGGKIYVDGQCAHTFNPIGRNGSLNNSVPLLIGKHADSSPKNFEGTLDELWIFRGSRVEKAPLLKRR